MSHPDQQHQTDQHCSANEIRAADQQTAFQHAQNYPILFPIGKLKFWGFLPDSLSWLTDHFFLLILFLLFFSYHVSHLPYLLFIVQMADHIMSWFYFLLDRNLALAFFHTMSAAGMELTSCRRIRRGRNGTF